MIDKCIVENCNNKKANGDIYFCLACRFSWRKWLGKIGETIILPADELLLLKKFQKGGI